MRSAWRLALAKEHWDIVSFLIDQPACSKDSELLNDIFNAAKKATQTALLKKLVENHSAQLRLLEKLSMLTQPSLQESCVNVEKLFSNHSWLVKAPLCFGLRRLGYTQVVTASLADFSIDELESTEVAEPTLSALGVRKQ